MKTAIYCFSGTGNNLMIAKRLAALIGETDIFPIRVLKDNKTIPTEYDWVGFVTPAYYSHVPPLVQEAMKHLTFSNHQKIFTIVGCGINRGAAHQDLREALKRSNKQAQLEYMIAMPGSYIISYGGFPDWGVKAMTSLANRKIDKIAKDILNNRQKSVSKYGLFYKEKYEKALKEKIDSYSDICQQYTVSKACIKCKTCIDVCPNRNISLQDDKIIFGNNCQQCMACIQWCPKKAIDYKGLTHERKHYHNPYTAVKDIKDFQQTEIVK